MTGLVRYGWVLWPNFFIHWIQNSLSSVLCQQFLLLILPCNWYDNWLDSMLWLTKSTKSWEYVVLKSWQYRSSNVTSSLTFDLFFHRCKTGESEPGRGCSHWLKYTQLVDNRHLSLPPRPPSNTRTPVPPGTYLPFPWQFSMDHPKDARRHSSEFGDSKPDEGEGVGTEASREAEEAAMTSDPIIPAGTDDIALEEIRVKPQDKGLEA